MKVIPTATNPGNIGVLINGVALLISVMAWMEFYYKHALRYLETLLVPGPMVSNGLGAEMQSLQERV
jgi:hypothetical protein